MVAWAVTRDVHHPHKASLFLKNRLRARGLEPPRTIVTLAPKPSADGPDPIGADNVCAGVELSQWFGYEARRVLPSWVRLVWSVIIAGLLN